MSLAFSIPELFGTLNRFLLSIVSTIIIKNIIFTAVLLLNKKLEKPHILTFYFLRRYTLYYT